jgi:hypothetical protein
MCESEESHGLIYAQKSRYSTKYLMNLERNFKEILKSA